MIALPRLVAAALLLCGLLALPACGKITDATDATPRSRTLRVLLDWSPNADHAPIYAALASGAFDRAGLKVELLQPSDPTAALRLVAGRRVDLAVSYQPDLLLARDKGLRVAAVAALVQRPLTSIMTLDRRIRSVRDLRGKRVGTAGLPYQSAYLASALKQANVPVSSVRETAVGFGLSRAMLSKKVDATVGAFWNVEGVYLRRQGRKPHIIRIDEAGIPTYNELILVGQMDALRDNGATVRRFLQALAAGAAELRRDQAPALQALLKANLIENNNLVDRERMAASLKATMKVFYPTDPDLPYGSMDTRAWEAYGRWMLAEGLIKRMPTPTSLTNEYLPGGGI